MSTKVAINKNKMASCTRTVGPRMTAILCILMATFVDINCFKILCKHKGFKSVQLMDNNGHFLNRTFTALDFKLYYNSL